MNKRIVKKLHAIAADMLGDRYDWYLDSAMIALTPKQLRRKRVSRFVEVHHFGWWDSTMDGREWCERTSLRELWDAFANHFTEFREDGIVYSGPELGHSPVRLIRYLRQHPEVLHAIRS